MASRLDLQNLLERLLGSTNVHYQPPESIKMSYPAIKYQRSDIRLKHANNSTYLKTNCYEIIVIDTLPDNEVINKLLELPNCKYDRPYIADNLHHDVLTLYY